MIAYGDGIDTHLDYWVIIATWLSHVAEVEDVLLLDVEFFEEVSHAEDFVHAWSDGVNRSGTTNFIVKFRGELFATSDYLFAFLAVGIPGVLFLGAGFLTESGESDLREAVLDNFVTFC